MQRRSFLGAILAAPAIVHSESLMKLWVPRQPKAGLLFTADELFDAVSPIQSARRLIVNDRFLPAPGVFRTLRDALATANDGDSVFIMGGHTEWEKPGPHTIHGKPGVRIEFLDCKIGTNHGSSIRLSGCVSREIECKVSNTPLSRPLSARFSNGQLPS